MKNGSYFCKLDVHKAYLHVEMDDISSDIAAISTHRGTYRVKCLYFGLKTAPNEFQKIIDQIILSLNGVLAYFDDILVQGSSKIECFNRLEVCLERLRRYNIHLNKSKCQFFTRQVTYLGHVISERGLEKSTDKVQAVLNSPRPHDVDSLRSFLGLANYYCKFVPNASEIMYPLNCLLQKGVKFKWTRSCEESFQTIKNEISSDRTLTPYDPSKPLTLATDASPYGLAGVLSHIINGEERPILFISRSLTAAEKNYSQLDREATAVYWSVKRLHQYLYGRHFTLLVDNKPIQQIFSPTKPLPVLAASRLLRYASYLSAFDFSIEHRSSNLHKNVDYLSRQPLQINHTEYLFTNDDYRINENQINFLTGLTPISPNELRQASDVDETIQTLKRKLLSGELSDSEFSIHEGILMKGCRIVIPETLQPKVLQELHSTHIGIVKMKMIARSHCYWKGIDQDIESVVKSCGPCSQVRNNPTKVPLHTWEEPSNPWSRIHMDYAGPFQQHHFFVVVDALTKWVEVKIIKQAPTSHSTINALSEIFSRQGLPEQLASDNATIFTSEEFKNFCKQNGIQQRFSAPNYPATNGSAERTIQTLKKKLTCMYQEKGSLQEKLYRFILKYHTTPLVNGKTPAELHTGRNLRTFLDIMKPAPSKIQTNSGPKVSKSFDIGERVQSRNYTGNLKWKQGTVVRRLGKLHYLIKLDHGYVLKRHVNQLKSSEVEADWEKERTYFQPDIHTPMTSKDVYREKTPNIQSRSFKSSSPGIKHSIESYDQTFPDKTQTFEETSIFPGQYSPKPLASSTPNVRRSSRVRKPVIKMNL